MLPFRTNGYYTAGVVTQGARGHSESQGSQATRDGYFCGSAEERGTEDTRNGR